MEENNVHKQISLEEQFVSVFTPNPERHIVCRGMAKDGRKLIETRKRPVNTADIARHLETGQKIPFLGYIPGTATGTTCLMIDLDDDGRHFPADELHNVTERIVKAATQAELSPYLETSCSGQGTHIWCFFKPEVPYQVATDAARTLTRRAGIPSVEIFPSSASPSGKMPLLPYSGVAEEAFGLGNTYLRTPTGQSLPLVTLPEKLIRTPAVLIHDLARQQTTTTATPYPQDTQISELLRLPFQRFPTKGNRHDALVAFLNIAHRMEALGQMADVLASEEIWKIWGADDSRSHSAWKEEIRRWEKNIAFGWNGPKRGYPYLRRLGYDTGTVRTVSAVSASVEVEDPWGSRQVVSQTLPPVPNLPVEMVPEPLRPWLTGLASETSTPLEVAAVTALSGLSILIGGSVEIQPSGPGTRWLVVPNLWAQVVLPPGSLKSSLQAESLRPLHVVQRAKLERHRKDMPRIRAQLAAAERNIAKASKEEIEEADLARLFALKEDLEARSRPPYLVTNDTTFERLGLHLHTMPRGVALVLDELYPFYTFAETKDRDNLVSLVQTGWSGDQSFTFSRATRPDITIDRPVISVIGAVQPGPLHAFLERNGSGTKGDKGLLARFQLTVYPDSLGDWHKPQAADLTEIHADIERLAHRIDGLYRSIPQRLQFDEVAQAMFDAWREALERRLRRATSHDLYQAHLSKYRSLVPSLAAIFKILEVAARDTDGVELDSLVGSEHLGLALKWVDFLEQHARKLYGVREGAPSPAIRLAEQIELGLVRHGMSLRDLRRKQWAGLATREQCDVAVQWLERAEWLKVVEVQAEGGKLSKRLHLHPDFRGEA